MEDKPERGSLRAKISAKYACAATIYFVIMMAPIT